ncbi:MULTISPECIES: protein phosphatase 2C domain-containing protein [Niastella]|uniref:Protein phosphatase 2C domain-containing protein n=1 Tax=Niastella soli TaxID=2821487 RepID=A0ABS3YNW5_9BACT|nr:protein phosphatase 2C domain-containing protein [Niastella soli]MBO9199565.1 protein phosphatase 2C domain-containing protein [Niastella soli]
MRIYTTLTIGEHHTNHCEDYLITAEIGKEKILCAVMDGCSMGTDSYFAATLTGKLLRKFANEYSYKEFISKKSDNLQQTLEGIIRQLFWELHVLKNSLQLNWDEVLNTLLIAVVDVSNATGEFLCIGDGLICINGEFFEFEQNNKPDYLGYHLQEDFDSWLSNQKQRISAQSIRDFSLVTDGIFTFSRHNNQLYQQSGNVADLLLIDKAGCESANMLDRKRIDIEKEWGLKPMDDLAIIRGIF